MLGSIVEGNWFLFHIGIVFVDLIHSIHSTLESIHSQFRWNVHCLIMWTFQNLLMIQKPSIYIFLFVLFIREKKSVCLCVNAGVF